MIEFKTNYTHGPWDRMYDWSIYQKYGPKICDILPWKVDGDSDLAELKLVEDTANINLILNAPKMAEYMMERSKKLSEEISYGDLVADHFELIGHIEPEKREELKTILSILKDAGVEVVEK